MSTSGTGRPTGVLHVGPHKTASISLERSFQLSREALSLAGVSYPDDLPASPAIDPVVSPGHAALALALRRDPAIGHGLFLQERETFAATHGVEAGRLEEVRRHLAAQPAGRVVLSSELFSTLTIDELTEALSLLGDDPVALMYTRAPLALAVSCWATKVRWGAGGSLPAFLRAAAAGGPDSPTGAGRELFERLLSVLPAERVVLLGTERSLLAPRGQLGDALWQSLGLALPGLVAATRHDNVAPPLARTELMRLVGRLPAEGPALEAALALVQRRLVARPLHEVVDVVAWAERLASGPPLWSRHQPLDPAASICFLPEGEDAEVRAELAQMLPVDRADDAADGHGPTPSRRSGSPNR